MIISSYPNFSVSKCHYRTQVQCLFAVSVRHSVQENLNPVELCSCSHRDGCEEVGRTRSAIPLRSVPLQTTTCVLQAFCVKILCSPNIKDCISLHYWFGDKNGCLVEISAMCFDLDKHIFYMLYTSLKRPLSGLVL